MSDHSKEPIATPRGRGHGASAKPKRKCFGFSEQLEHARKRKTESTEPDPWLVHKLAVAVVCGIFAWSYYVVMGRIVAPAIRRDKDRRIDQTAGIGVLVVFNVLWLMFVWTYVKAIYVRPGFAKDFVPRSDPPRVEAGRQGSTESLKAGPPYEAQHVVTREPSLEAQANIVQGPESLGLRVASPAGTEATCVGSPESRSKCSQSESPPRRCPGPQDAKKAEAESRPALYASGPEVATTLSGQSSGAEAAVTLQRAATQGSGPSYLNFPPPPDGYQSELPTSLISRVPPPIALKDERFRYCKRCRILKPLRTHHCRHCKTCVLKFDHHCVFIGHCIGARNYKYFINFLQWSSLYCAFVFILVLTVTVRTPPPGADDVLDGQTVGLMVVAAVFAMFTGGMFGSHTSMILNNITTVEQMEMQRMKERERRLLSRTLGFANFTAKRKLHKQWNHEWGSIAAEGNPWWLGTARNWSMVMGEEKVPWILPIRPRPHGDDGLNYELNPRYTHDGRWQRKVHWPKEYQ